MVLDKLKELLLFYSFSYIRFTRSQKTKLWKINGVVILCKMIRAYI